jgi:hypothetical protein
MWETRGCLLFYIFSFKEKPQRNGGPFHFLPSSMKDLGRCVYVCVRAGSFYEMVAARGSTHFPRSCKRLAGCLWHFFQLTASSFFFLPLRPCRRHGAVFSLNDSRYDSERKCASHSSFYPHFHPILLFLLVFPSTKSHSTLYCCWLTDCCVEFATCSSSIRTVLALLFVLCMTSSLFRKTDILFCLQAADHPSEIDTLQVCFFPLSSPCNLSVNLGLRLCSWMWGVVGQPSILGSPGSRTLPLIAPS